MVMVDLISSNRIATALGIPLVDPIHRGYRLNLFVTTDDIAPSLRSALVNDIGGARTSKAFLHLVGENRTNDRSAYQAADETPKIKGLKHISRPKNFCRFKSLL